MQGDGLIWINIVWLILVLRELVLGLSDPLSKYPKLGSPKLISSDDNSAPKYHGKVASEFVYSGEPWFAPPKFRELLIQTCLAVLVVGLFQITPEMQSSVSQWFAEHPVLSGFLFLVFLAVALIVGVVRQVFNKLMANAPAIELQGEDGQIFLSYLGDVPPFSWQYSVWPRVVSWIIVALTSVTAAFIGSELVANWTDASRPVVFWSMLAARWGLSALPALLCIDGGFWSRMSPPS